MNKIVFNRLKVEGFGSIVGFQTWSLDESGLNIIRGLNGSGKTTRFSALAWVLYGKMIKEGATVETWEHLRDDSWSGTMVSVSFYKGPVKYKVTRCKDYNKPINKVKGGNRLIVEENGTPVDHLKDKRDLQKYLEGILGMSYSLFTSSVLFAQKATRFIQESGPNKKAILEESFKINWITKAQDIAKAQKKEKQARFQALDKEIHTLNEALASYKDILKEYVRAREKFNNEQEAYITKLKEQISALETKVSESLIDIPGIEARINQSQEEITKLRDHPLIKTKDTVYRKAQSLRNEIKALAREIEQDYTRLENLENTPIPHCYECGQELDKVHNKSLREKVTLRVTNNRLAKKSREGELVALENDIETMERIQADIKKMQESKEEVQKQYREAIEHNSQIQESIGSLKELKEKLKEKKKETFSDNSKSISTRSYETQTKVKQLIPQHKKLKRSIKLLEWAINDPLSNSGIKSFLFHKLLERLNTRLRYFGKYSGIVIKLEIDLATGRKDIHAIITKGEAVVDYKDLSGGESKMVDVMIALGCGDVLLMDNPVSLRVYDEIAESLDPENTQIIINLLKAVSKTHSVFIITHNTSFHVEGANFINLKSHGKLQEERL
jgi:DNA repair exonuclease SbcCD ATPase subunit